MKSDKQIKQEKTFQYYYALKMRMLKVKYPEFKDNPNNVLHDYAMRYAVEKTGITID
jgi:hypothetical protein